MSEPNSGNDPKIIVDDDWKSQVEAEKEKLKSEKGTGAAEEPVEKLPEASFPIIVSMLGSQVLVSLGLIPDPTSNEPILRLDIAKHLIDLLDVLDKKTQGNLEADESAMLTSTIHQLRMAYVQVKEDAGKAKPGDGASGSSIELP